MIVRAGGEVFALAVLSNGKLAVAADNSVLNFE
jgi:hypothetical protein